MAVNGIVDPATLRQLDFGRVRMMYQRLGKHLMDEQKEKIQVLEQIQE